MLPKERAARLPAIPGDSNVTGVAEHEVRSDYASPSIGLRAALRNAEPLSTGLIILSAELFTLPTDGVKLLPLETPGVFDLAAGWLAQKENYQWLDFGNGCQPVAPALLRIMAQRDTHFLRAYTSDTGDTPIGICGLNSINRTVGTATFWGASGDKSFRSRGFGTLAGAEFLTLGFRDLRLRSINTWVVEHNPSLKIIERLGFRFAGRLRQCHHIDGRPYDRLLFDLLASEHREPGAQRWRPAERMRRPEQVAD